MTCRHLAGLCLVTLLIVLPAGSRAEALLARFVDNLDPATLIAGADGLGPPQQTPPAAPILTAGERVGYVILTSDYVDTTGYSGKPIHVVVALDENAVISAVRLVEHHEPIVLTGIPQARIEATLADYVGLDVAALATGGGERAEVDVVSGATVTVMVIDDTIVQAAKRAARALGLGGMAPADAGPAAAAGTRIARDAGKVETWQQLRDSGAVRRLAISIAEVDAAFAAAGHAGRARRRVRGEPGETFIELFAAQVSVPTIGRSLLGAESWARLRDGLEDGQQAILLAARGPYSFKGSGYVRGGIFDRFLVRQGERTIRFRDTDHQRIRRLQAEGAPQLKENDLFVVPSATAFAAAAPWQLELLVGREIGGMRKAFVDFTLDYRVPERFLEHPAPPATDAARPAAAASGERAAPLWHTLWRHKRWQIGALAVALLVLTAMFFFQGWLVRRKRLTERVRLAFMIFTLVGLGWYANAQLSVVNVLTVANAAMTGFSWGYFLMEPLIFILWGAVAISLVFWGRGAFCGWLCPFGALQELLNKAAQRLGVPQRRLPWWLHERLWALKYVLFLVLFGVSLHSLGLAERLAEVEPFKTAIVLKFDREWPYVLFAVGMLLPGLFIERFYCRYACPLGAALALPGKLRLFEWLKRYRECGSPCQRCARECMVEAIHPEGHINPNECIYCLHCQVVYVDDQRCYKLIQQRLRREQRAARSGGARSLTAAVADIEQPAGAASGTRTHAPSSGEKPI
ncbi:MAG: 4Fe-4S binding protein [Gammaproteobacteria bacterium]